MPHTVINTVNYDVVLKILQQDATKSALSIVTHCVDYGVGHFLLAGSLLYQRGLFRTERCDLAGARAHRKDSRPHSVDVLRKDEQEDAELDAQ